MAGATFVCKKFLITEPLKCYLGLAATAAVVTASSP